MKKAEPLHVKPTNQVADVLRANKISDPTTVVLTLYWSLFVGILTFWIGDKSTRQEETRAIIDQSTRMLANWLEARGEIKV